MEENDVHERKLFIFGCLNGHNIASLICSLDQEDEEIQTKQAIYMHTHTHFHFHPQGAPQEERDSRLDD